MLPWGDVLSQIQRGDLCWLGGSLCSRMCAAELGLCLMVQVAQACLMLVLLALG